MTAQKAPSAPVRKAALQAVAAVIAPGQSPFDALAQKATALALARKAPKVSRLTEPTEIGPGVVAQMMGNHLMLMIDVGPEARANAEETEKGALILGKAGPGYGRTAQLPGTDLALSLYLGTMAPKKGKN
jgi:hypothetical protein